MYFTKIKNWREKIHVSQGLGRFPELLGTPEASCSPAPRGTSISGARKVRLQGPRPGPGLLEPRPPPPDVCPY